MKCLRKYKWVKLPRMHLPGGKGLMGYWAKLASRAAFRKGNAVYCGHINPVTAGMWSGGVVGLKSILSAKKRVKALWIMNQLQDLGYISYSLDPKTKQTDFPGSNCLTLGEEDKRPIGKWGRKHLRYLKEHRPVLYTVLLLGGNLSSNLAEIDTRATEMYDQLMHDMVQKEGINEQLKAKDPMAWVGAMNNIRNVAEEIVNAEVIFAW